jgi:hypothetical protein
VGKVGIDWMELRQRPEFEEQILKLMQQPKDTEEI